MLERLEEARKAKKITYQQIAELLGYTKSSTISEKFQGKTNFSFDEAVKIQAVFFPEYDLRFLFDKN